MTRSRSVIWISSILLLSILIWSTVAKLDVASMAFGEVMPEGQTKRIQHLEGGIVQAIYVTEGQELVAGQPLYELSPTLSDASIGETMAKEASVHFKIMRLESQLQGRVDFPDLSGPRLSHREQYETEKALFLSERARYQTDLQVHELRINQKRAEVEEGETRKTGNEKRLVLIRSQVKISERLLKEQLVNEYEHLNLLKEKGLVENELDGVTVSIQRHREALKEAELSLNLLQQKHKEELQRDLASARIEAQSLTERMKTLEDSRSRTIIRAPVNGTVLSLFYVTIGGVVPPGGTLLTIVPESDSLLISARLHIGDVGFVHPKQAVRLSLLSSSLGGIVPIDGTVLQVSADALTDPKTGPYYQVLIRPLTDKFGTSENPYPLKPGLQVMASILIGERTVLSYFTEPLIGDLNRMLSER